ncbi:hypothetical protein PRVXH_000906 [Proteinivorax hydrogeniformans]|uniref:Lipoprotein n=1 Tax=Proteinivorax hydrogeniformans TaxID=1826727 RepID=A0AAU8HVZ2_9FIRM
MSFLKMLLPIFLLVTFTGCSNTYSIESLKVDLEEKGYIVSSYETEEFFIPTKTKRLKVNEETLYIYMFRSKLKMETAASQIDPNGAHYTSGSKVKSVSWVKPPSFYKRGRIIVQYFGEDEKVISDLTDILGEQFAGVKK